MQKRKRIRIEAGVLAVLWLIVAIVCSAYVSNEEPENIEDFETNTESDDNFWISPWCPVNDTSVNGIYMEV